MEINMGLMIKMKKTTFITNEVRNSALNISGDLIEQVDKYKYLGYEGRLGRYNPEDLTKLRLVVPNAS